MKSAELRKRQRRIETSVYCLEDIKNEIRYSRKAADRVLKDMEQKYPQLEWLSPESKSENSALGREFCRGLGKSDLEGQLKYCEIYAARFNSLLNSAKAERADKERLYVSLGAFGGIAVFILLV